jgi:hypothetical protein
MHMDEKNNINVIIFSLKHTNINKMNIRGLVY